MNGATRRILHVDMDAFFASVEQRDRAELRGRPVLVGGAGPRGVVTAASYEARPFGCRSAMPMAVARRLCPQAVVVPGRHARYREASDAVFEVLRSYTPLVEPLSIDEAFLDLTGSERLHGDAPTVAHRIKHEIRERTGLTASVGVAFNKFLAKLASDLEKPDGLVVVTPETVDRILPPLPVERLWGVGPKAAARLRRVGVRTVGDVQAAPLELLRRHIGNHADRVQQLARGEDDRPVAPDQQAKSISHEQTFGVDLAEPDAVRRVLMHQVESVGRRLRHHGLVARTVTVKIRYGEFETITRSATLPEPTDLTLEIRRAAVDLFDRWARRSFRPVRLIGMGAGQLATGRMQEGLFDRGERNKLAAVDHAIDRIVERFGTDSISRGSGAP